MKIRPTRCMNENETSVNVRIEEHEEGPRPVNKIIIAGDSLLDRMQIKAVTSCSTHKIDQQETDG